MNGRLFIAGSLLLVAVTAIAAGCGSGGGKKYGQAASPSATTPAPSSGYGAGAASQGSAALTAEAQQTAAGDIPDNQVFLTFRNTAEGYSLKYPEGWAQLGSAARVTFQDKNNLVRLEVAKGSNATVAGATAELNRLKQKTPSLRFDTPTRMTVGGKPVVKVVYSTESAPNPVTGRRVKLVVDRYYVPGASKHAVVDLATPDGVDNVDAYKLMIESFKWK
jgi:hypothetical protein